MGWLTGVSKLQPMLPHPCTSRCFRAVQVSDFGKGKASTAGVASMAAPPIALHAAKQGKLRVCLLGILLDGAKLKHKVLPVAFSPKGTA